MKVQQLMTRDVKTCTPEDTLNDVAGIMWEYDCGCVPVAESTGRLVGIVTDRDICMAAYTKGAVLKELQVRGAMATEVVSCTPETDVREAQQTMRGAQIRRLPVVDDARRIVGLLALGDVATEATRERRAKRKREIPESSVCETLASVSRPREDASP